MRKGGRRRGSPRWWKIFLFAVLLYAGTFLVWSRARTFTVRGESRRVWSFFATPARLSALNPNRWRAWKQREEIAAVAFWPCVLIDEKLTRRRYWPAQFADPPRIEDFTPR